MSELSTLHTAAIIAMVSEAANYSFTNVQFLIIHKNYFIILVKRVYFLLSVFVKCSIQFSDMLLMTNIFSTIS